MRALDRKLLRDLWHMRGQALAIGLVIACGVSTFVMSLSMLDSLERALATYYEKNRFADAFTHLKRAPNSLAGRIAELPGVARVQTRVVVNVTLDVPGLTEPAVGRLVSIPDWPVAGLNELYLRRGRYPEPGRGEVLASEAFVEAHALMPGASVTAVINGRRQLLRIVGVALSPEYVYQIREGEVFPDDRRFGVFWMGYTELAAGFDMQGAFNAVALSLLPGASLPEILRRLDRLTEPYGGIGAFGRADQGSHKFISNELEELRGMAMMVPTIFLVVAAFLLNVVLSRLVGTQREQIATLKAFGYSRGEIGLHYLKLVLLIVSIGAALGTGVGAWFGSELTELYAHFFRFPEFHYHLSTEIVAAAIVVSGGSAIAGTIGAVRHAARLPPAEAMRPEPPASYRATFVERLGLQRMLSPAARMVLRNLERRPLRALMTCLGIGLGVAILILGNFMVDSIEYVIDTQFHLLQREDVTVALVEPAGPRVLHDLQRLPGVWRVEGFRAIPARLRAGPRSRQVGIMGLPAEGQLHRLIDLGRRDVPLPPEGLVLSEKLGEVLGVGPGDMLTVEVLEGERPVRQVPVAALFKDFTGLGAYMDVHAANRLMREGGVVSGAFLAADPARIDSLYRALKESPRVGAVTVKAAALESFQKTVAENLLRMQAFIAGFAGVICFGVVYNSARISLAERSRELATLRVLGFTRGEISRILLGELAVLTFIAIPIGWGLGYTMALGVTETTYNTELFRIPLIVSRWTFGFAAAVTLTAALASGLVVRRMLDRLDLVAVLKSRE